MRRSRLVQICSFAQKQFRIRYKQLKHRLLPFTNAENCLFVAL